ncbi:hypothetical protein [Paenibacillus soyae]|uniref:Uncharacterized protein n=1 Tax=Paenibacillus soyae TaxID=2969249 RepID=A0A9X2SAX3_9BACL|nr:hypothetical protein [Paenibacillus soyae]MCR2804157.1 hypothetical protein [Paenibacillus soyae]
MQSPFLFRVICLTVVMLVAAATTAFAAPFEFTATAKTAFDQMVEEANSKTANELEQSYAELQALQQQEIGLDSRISALHYQNEERDASIRKRIRTIDSAKISALEAELSQTEKKFEPLFELYKSHKAQLSIAKATKNKDLIAIANAQAEITKSAVQAANAVIDAQEASLKKAKSDASAKMKTIRGILETADAHETRIKSAKSTASSVKKLFTTESKVLVQNVRKKDAAAASLSLARMLIYERQILIQKANAHYYEQQISAVISKAEEKLQRY